MRSKKQNFTHKFMAMSHIKNGKNQKGNNIQKYIIKKSMFC